MVVKFKCNTNFFQDQKIIHPTVEQVSWASLWACGEVCNLKCDDILGKCGNCGAVALVKASEGL
jgi:hypothetical protein